MELDLHGVKHSDVDRIVENFVLLGNTPMTIITGKSMKMTRLVLDVLKRHRFTYWTPSYNVGIVKVIG